jgi:ketosteroid isomerase-like protein
MGESDVEVVRQMFERFSASGLESALDLISEEASFEVPGDMSAEPDVYEGHAGARRYFAGFDGLIEDVRFEPLEIEEAGDALIVWIRLSGRGAASGIDVEQHAAIVVGVEDGKVVRLRPYPDMEAARESLR